MMEANSRVGQDEIDFNIPGSGGLEIVPATRLPILTDQACVIVDGYTQPGSAPNTSATVDNAVIRIQLKGNGASGIDGIMFTSANNTVQGLALYNFRRALYIFGPNAHDNVIVGNFSGTNAAGTFVSPTQVGG